MRWALAVGVSLAISAYGLSWPFVMELGPRGAMTRRMVQVGTDPQSGEAIIAAETTIPYSPHAELFYRPLQLMAWEGEMTPISPVLRLYSETVSEVLP